MVIKMEKRTNNDANSQSNLIDRIFAILLLGIFRKVANLLSKLIDAASGFDREILATHGSQTCHTKSRAIGIIVLVSSIVGGFGMAFKSYGIVSGFAALPVAIFAGCLYAIITYNLERLLAIGITPYLTTKQRLTMFISRLVVAIVMASFQAAPWVLLALATPIQTKLTALGFEEQTALRSKVDGAYGIAALASKAEGLNKDLKLREDAIRILPETVIDVRQLADSCKSDYEKLISTNRRKISALAAKLPAISNIELDKTISVVAREQAERHRLTINNEIAKLQSDIGDKQVECVRLNNQAVEAKTRYLAEAATKRDAAVAAIAEHQKEVTSTDQKLKTEYERVESVAKKGFLTNSGAEIKAAAILISEEFYARLIACSIWLLFFLLDVLSSSLKLALKAGKYDEEKRAIEELRGLEIELALHKARSDNQTEIMVAQAKNDGIQAFHRTDNGGVFERQERASHFEQAIAAEEARDMRVATLKLSELTHVIEKLNALKNQVQNNPILSQKLHDILNNLRSTASTATT